MRSRQAPPPACRRATGVRDPGPAAVRAGHDGAGPAHPRDRHPRRLQHHPPGPGAARRMAGWSPWSPRRVMPRSPPPTSLAPACPTGSTSSSARPSTTLPTLAGREPFDLVFIDADKAGNPDYLKWSLRLTRPGSVIVADNVVRGGDVLDGASIDPSVVGVRRFTELLGCRAPTGGHRDPDRRREGLRRLRHRGRHRPLSIRRHDAPAPSRRRRARPPRRAEHSQRCPRRQRVRHVNHRSHRRATELLRQIHPERVLERRRQRRRDGGHDQEEGYHRGDRAGRVAQRGSRRPSRSGRSAPGRRRPSGRRGQHRADRATHAEPVPAKIAWPIRNDASEMTSPTTSATPP